MTAHRTERLLNLLLCLMSSGGRCRGSRCAVVPGYEAAASDGAFERMFERDKEELRGMGVPVETVLTPTREVRATASGARTTPCRS